LLRCVHVWGQVLSRLLEIGGTTPEDLREDADFAEVGGEPWFVALVQR
jgi:hypothetical protein